MERVNTLTIFILAITVVFLGLTVNDLKAKVQQLEAKHENNRYNLPEMRVSGTSTGTTQE